jgi:putative nucleotidyltransferase with HDIG domain
MPINVHTLISLFATATYGGVWLVVMFSRPLTKLQRAFIVYLTAMFIWSISSLIMVTDFWEPLIWFKTMVSSSFVMLLSLFYFVQILFAQRRKWTILVFWYGLLAICLTMFTNLVVKSVVIESGFIFEYELHPFIGLVAGPGYSLFIFSVVELIRGYQATDSEIQRTRLRYLITAVVIILLFTIINFTELGKYPIDVAANGVAAVLIAYAILRHSLLDIRFVVRTGLLYSIVTGITGALYYLIISITLTLFESFSGLQIFTLSMIVALITSLILSPLREKVQQWIDRLFYRVKYDASFMLQRLSETTAMLMDLDDITEIILSEIIDIMKLEHASFFVKYESRQVYQLIAHHGTFGGFTNVYQANHPIVQWLSNDQQFLTKHQLNVNPVFKSLWESERFSIDSQKIELFISLVAGGEMVGFFTIGGKKSRQPFTQDDHRILVTVANQTAIAVKNSQLYNDLQDTFVQTVVTLANAVDIRDTYTSDHSQRIAALAVETAKLMGCDEEVTRMIYWGSLLHDIGKIGIPDAILLKAGPLDDDEWEIIKSHPTVGANIIQPIKQLAHISPIIQYSHEWYNGKGYPAGIKGGEIPLGARIVAVVDAFSAMMDQRVYKDAISFDETIKELNKYSGIQFDPQVVEAFMKVLMSEEISEILKSIPQDIILQV